MGLHLPVVSHDGGGQHTREQPAKLSQRVQEGTVVGLHVGALQGNVRMRRWLICIIWGRACASACQKPGLTSMTVHCSTTMVSLAGGEGLLSSYTNSPSNDRGTGSPGKTPLLVMSQYQERGKGRRGAQRGHGPNRKWSIHIDYVRKENKARGRGRSPQLCYSHPSLIFCRSFQTRSSS